MLFTVGLLIGLALGAGLLAYSRRSAASRATAAAWPPLTSLALGIASLAALGAGIGGMIDTALAIAPVAALQFAAAVFGVGRLMSGDRGWQSWLGSALAVVPTLFWVVFAVAEIVGPAH